MHPIHVFGSINIDISAQTNRYPKQGETIHGESLELSGGGKGANQALAAHLLGGDVTLHGCTGNDAFAKAAVKTLKENDLPLDHVITLEHTTTGSALITRSKRDNRIIVIGGANMAWEMSMVPHSFEKNAIVMIQNEIPEPINARIMERAHASGATVIYDPAPARHFDTSLYRTIDFFTPNKTEAEKLSGMRLNTTHDLKKALHYFYDLGVRVPIITLGDKGLVYLDQGVYKYLKPLLVDAVDTTAAGDAFCGALARVMSEKGHLEDAVDYARKASAYATTRAGAQQSMPTTATMRRPLV